LSGTCERDGTELALNQPYSFSGVKSKLLTWHGCEIEVEGPCDEYIAEQTPEDEPAVVSYLNLHLLLAAQRRAAERGANHFQGPRVMVTGTAHSGRSSLVRTLAAWATKMGQQTCVVNADPREGVLSLPGTLSAAVFGTVMDVESEGGGWGTTPSSGPSPVPVKLPLVYYYGAEKAEEDAGLYMSLVGRMAGAVTARMAEDVDVKSAGLLIDAPTVNISGKSGIDILAHIIDEFSGKMWCRLRGQHHMANEASSQHRHRFGFRASKPGAHAEVQPRKDDPGRTRQCRDVGQVRRCGR